MPRILKYPMDMHLFAAQIPANAEVLHVAFQHERATVWARVPDGPPSYRLIRFFPTGIDVSDEYKFIGTLINSDHCFVLHAFEDKP